MTCWLSGEGSLPIGLLVLSIQQKLVSQISQLLVEPGSLNFVYALRVIKYIVYKKMKVLMFILPSFLCPRHSKNAEGH